MENTLIIKTNMATAGQTRSLYFSSQKTVQQVIVETYLLYRRLLILPYLLKNLRLKDRFGFWLIN